MAHIYLQSDNYVLNLWASSLLTISITLLLGLILWREHRLPKLYRTLPINLFALIIICACIRPYTPLNGHELFMVMVWSQTPQVLLFYPISIATSLILTLATWGSLKTLFLHNRPARLSKISWIAPAIYALIVLVVAAWWFSFAHALSHGASIL
jgi:hypothetical protein